MSSTHYTGYGIQKLSLNVPPSYDPRRVVHSTSPTPPFLPHRLYQNVAEINHHRPLCPSHRGSPHILSAG
jgi:hypothetical protein